MHLRRTLSLSWRRTLMPVHIGQLTTDVIPEPEPSSSASPAPAQEPWDRDEQTREALWHVAREHARTAADGLDD